MEKPDSKTPIVNSTEIVTPTNNSTKFLKFGDAVPSGFSSSRKSSKRDRNADETRDSLVYSTPISKGGFTPSKDSESVADSLNLTPTVPLILESSENYQAPLQEVSVVGLNRLKAAVERARLKKTLDLDELEKNYELALHQFNVANRNYESSSTTYMPSTRSASLGTRHDVSLAEMVQEEKMTSGASLHNSYARKVMKNEKFSDSMDALEDYADEMENAASSTPANKYKKSDRSQMQGKAKHSNALNQLLQPSKVETCRFCVDETKNTSLEVLAAGTRVYLALPPPQTPVIPFHCLIVPNHHCKNTLECDEDTWTEIRNFMKCLLRMAHSQNQRLLFTETAIGYKTRRRHAWIECFSIPSAVHATSSAYFKQCIVDVGVEWSQHRKIIDSRKNGFHRSLVKQLEYFHVWFDLNGGYGHVIEGDEFPYDFAHDVVKTMMAEELDEWDPSIPVPFIEIYKPYDWTHMLQRS